MFLPWDSGFFGIATARLIHQLSNQEDLSRALAALRASNIRLVYWNTKEDECKHWGEELGGTYLGVKSTYSRLIHAHNRPADARLNCCECLVPSLDTTDLTALAIACGEHSRFAIDPNFPRSCFTALYVEWMRRSVARELASEVFVIRKAHEVAGLVTVAQHGGTGEIGLLSVGRFHRGNRFGESLVLRACDWFAEQGCNEACVVTQKHNVAACRLYEKCGFRQTQAEHVFHFWLSSPIGP